MLTEEQKRIDTAREGEHIDVSGKKKMHAHTHTCIQGTQRMNCEMIHAKYAQKRRKK